MQTLDISKARNEELNLKGQELNINHAETLEEIFKRVQFNKVDLEATSLNDEVYSSLRYNFLIKLRYLTLFLIVDCCDII